MGDQDWTRAQEVVFPSAVLAMFVSDLASLVQSGEKPRGEFGEPRVVAQATPCSDATNFLGKMISTLFNALKLSEPPAEGFFGAVVNALAVVWNKAVDLAQGVVEAVIGTITAPVFGAIRAAAAALGVATAIASYLRNEALTVEPSAPTMHFSVGDRETGSFVGRSTPLDDTWPPAIRDSAKAAGTTLPDLVPAGAKYTWRIDPGQDLIEPTGALTGTVDSAGKATLRFQTPTEDQEAHERGELTSSRAVAVLTIPNDQLTSFLTLAQQQVNAAIQAALSFLPAPIRQAAADVITAMLRPALERLEAEIAGSAAGVFTLTGYGALSVSRHTPPSTTTTTGPTTTLEDDDEDGGDDFCEEYRAMVAWALSHQAQPTLEAWAAEIGHRMAAMRHLVPPGLLSAFDDVAYIYGLIETGANAGVLGGEMERLDFVGDTALLNNTCGVTAGIGPG